MKTLLLTASVLGLTTTAALADAQSRIEYRESRQLTRIERGIQDGSLNRREAAHLLRGEARIARMDQRAEADGHLSRWKRHRIWHAQNEESRQIWRDRHNWN